MELDALNALSGERANVVAALKNAAAATGSDFHYLLGTAMRESSLKPQAQSSTSSAAGLFQFVDQTWLGLIKNHGAQHGLSSAADAIVKGDDGRYHAREGERAAILSLRKDPQVSALMAGEYAKQTQTTLTTALGRPVCGGELYAAHFLGPDAACKLIRLAQSDPDASAASVFKDAAAANKSVFFQADGSPKTMRAVYDWAMRQPGGNDTLRAAPQSQGTATLMAANASDSDIQTLLTSVMNWQPKHGFFGGGGWSPGGNVMSFAPGLLGLLSDSGEKA